jgi:hypothetical protein
VEEGKRVSVHWNEDTLFLTIPDQGAPTVSVVSNPLKITLAAKGLQGEPGPAAKAPPIIFGRRGTCSVLAAGLKYRMLHNATLSGYAAAMSAPPVGCDLLADITVNDVVVATVVMPDGQVDLPEVTTDIPVLVGDYVRVVITQVGSTEPGDDLSIFIEQV